MSFFDHDPDKVREQMERLNLSPFDKKAQATPDLSKSVRSWADELYDVVYELEEDQADITPWIERLREVYKSMEDLLDSMRDETRSPDSPHRSARGR